jgi:hypothetical protein
MADERPGEAPEPRGFGEHSRGLAGEYAHEQGWGLAEEQRVRQPDTPQDTDGGNNYNYSAESFGDDPVNMDRITPGEDASEDTARQALGLNTDKENK